MKRCQHKVRLMIMRKVVLCLFGLLLAASAHADWEGNALIGISGDYARYDGTYNIGLYYTGFPNIPKTEYSDRQRNTGFGGGVLLGYQVSCNDWLLGAEISADWLDVDKRRVFVFTDLSNFISWNSQLQTRNNGFYGLSTRVGYQMAPFFLSYLRLGIEAIHQEFSAVFQGAPDAYPFSLKLKDDVWRSHVYVGVGAEFPLPISCHTHLRMEYNYHFPSGNLQSSGRIMDGVVDPAFELGARPAIDMGKVSLVWNF